MKKLGQFLLVAVLATSFIGCKKEGCTDKEATNYNEKAKKDDGTCKFPADVFVANYKEQTDNYVVTITKTSNKGLSISNLLDNGKVLNATVTDDKSFSISPNNTYITFYYSWGTIDVSIDNGLGTLNGNNINVSLNFTSTQYDNSYNLTDIYSGNESLTLIKI